jgi:hypothetical protein
MSKEYIYKVSIVRKVEHHGLFIVTSETKLTEEEVFERAQWLAFQGAEPKHGWEEVDTRYDEDSEIQDGHADLKDE